MRLSDISVERPVFACVLNILLLCFGLFALSLLPVREYPDIDPPIVSINTSYQGASAAVVEAEITQILEDRVAGIEGIQSISSSSRDGRSAITLEFALNRDIDSATNDVRDRVSRALSLLPEEAEAPQIAKTDSDADPVVWLILTANQTDRMALTDYAERYLLDRLSVVDGVSSVTLTGERQQALRVWLDPNKMAAYRVTSVEVEAALRSENVENPAGRLESVDREFNLRLKNPFKTPDDFEQLIVRQTQSGQPVRLGDIARIAVAPKNPRNDYRVNGTEGLGIGVVKQSKANALAMSLAVRSAVAEINRDLPQGMQLAVNYDSSQFIEASLNEVLITLAIAAGLVVIVIWLFLGSLRATIIPALTVPISLVSAFILLQALGFSINILTLLAMVLAVGLVVDDTIVVVENIHRRLELGEPPLLAARNGSRQVAFAVIATTAVLLAVFAPIAMMEGNIGRLFREFSLTLAAAITASGFTALTLAPALSSAMLKTPPPHTGQASGLERFFEGMQNRYAQALTTGLRQPFWLLVITTVLLGLAVVTYRLIPKELAPKEDRGQIFVTADGPEGASLSAMKRAMAKIEAEVLPYVQQGEAERVIVRTPRFGGGDDVNSGNALLALKQWDSRRPSSALIEEINGRLKNIPDARINAVERSAFGGRPGQPVQIALGGPDYPTLALWRDQLIAHVNQENPHLRKLDSDYKPNKPQISLRVDRTKAHEVGVLPALISHTLETLMSGRNVTTWSDRGQEYDVILQAEPGNRDTPADILQLALPAQNGSNITLQSLMSLNEGSTSPTLNRYDRLRTITISAGLAPGYSLGEGLSYLEKTIRTQLPPEAQIRYKGDSLEFKKSGAALYWTFAASILVVYLVLAAQFESLIQPLVILTTVPLGLCGAFAGLWFMGMSINIYSQVGIVMLIGLATKNGILIVEFANQLRDAGESLDSAIVRASAVRLRPILMTSIATVAGALPLMLASGAGAEARSALGTVIFYGVSVSTLLTLVITPVFYRLLCQRLSSPNARRLQLQKLEITT